MSDALYKMFTCHEDTKTPTLFLTYLTKQSLWRHGSTPGPSWEPYGTPTTPDQEVFDAVAVEATDENKAAVIEEIMRTNHYCMLNTIPVVSGTRWVVTEALYWHFKEMLPPMRYPQKSRGFAMSEFSHGNVTSAYYFENGHYWHEYVEYSRG